MNTRPSDVNLPARVAANDEGIGFEELVALAAPNHDMPLEALCHDLTPPGLHYTPTHYDIPCLEARDWRLSVTGLRHPVRLFLAGSSLPAVTDGPRHHGIRGSCRARGSAR
jgi:hypothetical protein